jgi:hypothetical protein
MSDSEIPLDCEDWSIVFQAYRDRPQLAIDLAQHFQILKQYLQSEPNSVPDAVAAIDRAINALYRHTPFEKLGRDLFRRMVEGELSIEQERMMRDLGVDLTPVTKTSETERVEPRQQTAKKKRRKTSVNR